MTVPDGIESAQVLQVIADQARARQLAISLLSDMPGWIEARGKLHEVDVLVLLHVALFKYGPSNSTLFQCPIPGDTADTMFENLRLAGERDDELQVALVERSHAPEVIGVLYICMSTGRNGPQKFVDMVLHIDEVDVRYWLSQ